MSKQILPHELAEIVTGLLVRPELLGELDSPEKHQDFMLDIGRVVAEHCGGDINQVSPSDTTQDYLRTAHSSPYLSVSPNDSIPSLYINAWAYHDRYGWEEEENALADAGNSHNEDCSPLTDNSIKATRTTLQSLLSNLGIADGLSQQLKFEMQDWRVSEGVAVERPGDDRHHYVTANLGGQSCLEFVDENNDPSLGVMVEINHGVPAIHIDVNGGDTVLHIHAAQGGLVLTPNSPDHHFTPAELDRFSYEDDGSLAIR